MRQSAPNDAKTHSAFMQFPGDPRRWNRFAYAINSPLVFTDKTGLDIRFDRLWAAPKGRSGKAQDDTVCIKRADLKLIAAALNIDTATMEAAIKSGADVNVAVEGLGPSIVIASLGYNYSGVQLLLDRGANVNEEDSEGHTALKKLIACC